MTSPTRESFHLHIARTAYVEGRLDLEEFERSAQHVLRGGTLDRHGRVTAALRTNRQPEEGA